MIKYLFIFSFIHLVISSVFLVELSPIAQAEEGKTLPIYYYWDNESPDRDEDYFEEVWSKQWNASDQLNGQIISNCSNLEEALAGRAYSYEVARKIGPDGFCPLTAMQARIIRPRRALFDANRPDMDIYRHLDMSSLHWGDLDLRLGQKGHYTLAQLSLKGVGLNKNQIAFDVGERGYQINIIMLADFEGNGGQQVYCDFWYYDSKTREGVNFPMLLTREKRGGPIIAKPVYVKKPASFRLPKEVRDNMIDKDPRYDYEPKG